MANRAGTETAKHPDEGADHFPMNQQTKQEPAAMGQTFNEVKIEDFSKITVERQPHQQIEMAIITIGGGGMKGMAYKDEVLAAAGWRIARLGTYAGKPELAAEAFNRIRSVLAMTEDPTEILDKLSVKEE
jgi:hypothetical protein